MVAFEAMQLEENRQQETLIELLENIVERLDSGVLVLNREGEVVRINQAGTRLLKPYLPPGGALSVLETDETVGTYQVYRIESRDSGAAYTVGGHLYVLNSGPYTQVLLFGSLNTLRANMTAKSALEQIDGISTKIQQTKRQLQMAAVSSSSVLIYAEHGLGKLLYASAIHEESSRRDKPLVTIDCALLPGDDLEKRLFGAVTLGSAPGSRGKPGQIEAANGGTLFLDNVESLPLSCQQRIVSLVERQEITRIGSAKPRRINIRVITATGSDLMDACRQGQFDWELYYLISVLPINIPPLRERKEDIRILGVAFIDQCARKLDKNVISEERDFWLHLERYDWPGNIRELKNAIEYAVNMMPVSGSIGTELLPPWLHLQEETVAWPAMTLEEAERLTIIQALRQCRQAGLPKETAAKLLGIGPATLYRKPINLVSMIFDGLNGQRGLSK